MQILSGAWQIALDPQNEGQEQRWYDQAGPEAVAAPVLRQAVALLPRRRRLDPTRLVLLSSGRWDGGGRLDHRRFQPGSVYYGALARTELTSSDTQNRI
jgi:hypothetical protein